MPGQGVDDHVEDEPNMEGINADEPMPENESSNKSGYSGPTFDDVCRMICEALKEREKKTKIYNRQKL